MPQPGSAQGKAVGRIFLGFLIVGGRTRLRRLGPAAVDVTVVFEGVVVEEAEAEAESGAEGAEELNRGAVEEDE